MVLYLPSDDFCKDSMGALREMIKARMRTISKQTLRYELGVSRIWTLTNSRSADRVAMSRSHKLITLASNTTHKIV